MDSAGEVENDETITTPEKKKSPLVRNIRYAFYILYFCMAFFIPYERESSLFEHIYDVNGVWIKVIFSIMLLTISIGFPYLAIFMVIGVQSINPLSADRWQVPDEYSNPLNLFQPLYFLHFASLIAIYAAAGMMISCIWKGIFAFFDGLIVLIMAVNIFNAIRLCPRIFKKNLLSSIMLRVLYVPLVAYY